MAQTIVIESKEELLKMFKEIAAETVQNEDQRLYADSKEFAEEVGLTLGFFKNNILPHPDFSKCVIQMERKYHIKRKEGRAALQKIMDQHRK